VIGAGPVGLAAAARLVRRGLPTVVLEAGPGPGASVREWGHVRLFSPWDLCLDPVAAEMLEEAGWDPPPADELPSGSELVERYLEPLAELEGLRGAIRYGHRVTAVTRDGRDRLKGTDDRGQLPFLLRWEADGVPGHLRARAVIDASGTWTRPRPLGGHGLPALGEEEAADRIRYGIHDVLGADRGRYAGRRTAVVGAGHSAANVLLDLVRLGEDAPGTEALWILRGGRPGRVFRREEDGDDQLEARGALERTLREEVEAGRIEMVTGFGTRAVERRDGIVALVAEDGRSLAADRVVGVTGFRPDLEMLRELRLDMDPLTEAPRALGPLIDPNLHDCGTVPPHGAEELGHPEPGFYMVGMTSYGRAPTFLLPTGYEQVRSVVAALAGDEEAARSVDLELPGTGVCRADAALETDAGEACRV
jgi:cation diffusion facilitator CzcD-associated flavoprotein CzcO